jgi:extracellular elastinolytic metalloproteinase
MIKNIISLLTCSIVYMNVAYSQDNFQISVDAIHEKYPDLAGNKLFGWVKTDEVYSKHNGVTHLYLRETYRDIEIYNCNITTTIRNSKVVALTNNLVANKISNSDKLTANTISPEDAVHFAAIALKLPAPAALYRLPVKNDAVSKSEPILLSAGGISLKPIPAKKVYVYHKQGVLQLCWDLSIYEMDQQNWWSVRIDATTGALVGKNNWVTKCTFSETPDSGNELVNREIKNSASRNGNDNTTAQYRVFPFPTENPDRGSSILETDPSDADASPNGWLDVDGISGSDFTITRGNNVWAYEDRASSNQPGYSPDAGQSLNFDYNYAPLGTADDNLNAAITNLFYVNNRVHDIFYHYGFDEQAGNFQQNNYSKGGAEGDVVFAESQDGSGFNNANFATPPDGANPRMQMYLWTPLPAPLTVNSPDSIKGQYIVGNAAFGPQVSEQINGDLIIAQDNQGVANDGCSSLVNNVAGKIVVIDRGFCTFKTKVRNAQLAGAIAVLIVDNGTLTTPLTLGDDPNVLTPITISTLSMLHVDGERLKSSIKAGTVVNVTFNPNPPLRDASFDNGVVTHEYGHGISNRLTGGPSNTSCLTNAEQMGEGWSDYFGLMMTMKPGDQSNTKRTIGTFDLGESSDAA